MLDKSALWIFVFNVRHCHEFFLIVSNSWLNSTKAFCRHIFDLCYFSFLAHSIKAYIIPHHRLALVCNLVWVLASFTIFLHPIFSLLCYITKGKKAVLNITKSDKKKHNLAIVYYVHLYILELEYSQNLTKKLTLRKTSNKAFFSKQDFVC